MLMDNDRYSSNVFSLMKVSPPSPWQGAFAFGNVGRVVIVHSAAHERYQASNGFPPHQFGLRNLVSRRLQRSVEVTLSLPTYNLLRLRWSFMALELGRYSNAQSQLEQEAGEISLAEGLPGDLERLGEAQPDLTPLDPALVIAY